MSHSFCRRGVFAIEQQNANPNDLFPDLIRLIVRYFNG